MSEWWQIALPVVILFVFVIGCYELFVMPVIRRGRDNNRKRVLVKGGYVPPRPAVQPPDVTIHTDDIIDRLEHARRVLDTAMCECDPSVGYVCDVCGEGQLLLDAKKEIIKLRKTVDSMGSRIDDLRFTSSNES